MHVERNGRESDTRMRFAKLSVELDDFLGCASKGQVMGGRWRDQGITSQLSGGHSKSRIKKVWGQYYSCTATRAKKIDAEVKDSLFIYRLYDWVSCGVSATLTLHGPSWSIRTGVRRVE